MSSVWRLLAQNVSRRRTTLVAVAEIGLRLRACRGRASAVAVATSGVALANGCNVAIFFCFLLFLYNKLRGSC